MGRSRTTRARRRISWLAVASEWREGDRVFLDLSHVVSNVVHLVQIEIVNLACERFFERAANMMGENLPVAEGKVRRARKHEIAADEPGRLDYRCLRRLRVHDQYG